METTIINFNQATYYIGRNGTGTQQGIALREISGGIVMLWPVNSKDKLANCHINIPKAHIMAFIGELQKYLPEEEAWFSIAPSWNVLDVLAQAENDGVELTSEEAKEILQWIDAKHDASIGINWEVISTYIDRFMDQAKPEPPFERFIYNDRLYLVRTVKGCIVAGYDLQAELIDLETGLPKSEREAFNDCDITYYADEDEMKLSDDELFNRF